MKKFLIIIAGSVFVLSLASCTLSRPIATAPTENNRTYKVDYLFEHDGVKVYRFWDYGGYVYFTSRGDGVTAVRSDSARTTVRTIEVGRPLKTQ